MRTLFFFKRRIDLSQICGAMLIIAAAGFFVWGFVTPVKKPTPAEDCIIDNVNDTNSVRPPKKKCC